MGFLRQSRRGLRSPKEVDFCKLCIIKVLIHLLGVWGFQGYFVYIFFQPKHIIYAAQDILQYNTLTFLSSKCLYMTLVAKCEVREISSQRLSLPLDCN